MNNNSHFVWLLNQIANLAAVNANAQEAILAAEYVYYIVCVCVCVYNGPHYAHKELERERERERDSRLAAAENSRFVSEKFDVRLGRHFKALPEGTGGRLSSIELCWCRAAKCEEDSTPAISCSKLAMLA